MSELLTRVELPNAFDYPSAFVRVVELGLTNLEPWWILQGDTLRDRQLGIEGRYSDRTLVVFAMRRDCDDVACWDLDKGGVAIVHDFASQGWEQRDRFDSFESWLRKAIDDLIEFGG